MITQSELKEILHYSPETGYFTWLKPTSNRVKKGCITGQNTNSGGYHRINIHNNSYMAHRLVFVYMSGTMPKYVDHINHNRNDNRWGNLRPATREDNNKNMSLSKRNKSGCTGVTWFKRDKTWQASINVYGKSLHLGYHDKKETAITIRKAAEGWYGFHKNHGAAK